jgi:putative DNA primase/helicase
MVLSVEVEGYKHLAEDLVKMLTGGDTITARHLYQELFEFVPKFKLWLASNGAPKIKDTDDAIWRRILRVPFEHEIPTKDRDPKVKATLRDTEVAGSAILTWIVKGCLRWQKEGLIVPEIIKESTEAYRQSQDPLKDFLEEVCEFSTWAHVTVTGMWEAYDNWAGQNGVRYLLGRQEFNKRLEAMGCERKPKKIRDNALEKGKTKKCWTGVKLKDQPTKDESGETFNEDQQNG